MTSQSGKHQDQSSKYWAIWQAAENQGNTRFSGKFIQIESIKESGKYQNFPSGKYQK